MRKRPEPNWKNIAPILHQDNKTIAKDRGAYGKAWALKYKHDGKALPSLEEILEGLMGWFVSQ